MLSMHVEVSAGLLGVPCTLAIELPGLDAACVDGHASAKDLLSFAEPHCTASMSWKCARVRLGHQLVTPRDRFPYEMAWDPHHEPIESPYVHAGTMSFNSLEECAWCLLDVAQLAVCRLGAVFGQDLVHVAMQHLQEAPFGTPQELITVLTNHLP